MRLLTAGVAAAALLLAGCGQGGNESEVTITGTPSGTPSADDTSTPSPSDSAPPSSAAPAGPQVVEEVATGLEAPWGLDFLPDGDALVTERDTRRVLRISAEDRQVTEVGTVDEAAPEGEGGLLGLAVSPEFDQDRLVYLYLSTDSDNRVVRATLDGDRLGTPEPILTGIPNGFIHDGGRLEFGPDGLLYVSTGETGQPELAQQRDGLAGKILRLTPDGRPAPGNPFGTAVWSWGHRNVQGLAFDDAGSLWASEFGQDEFDELNRIDAGANYGWPEVEGEGGGQGLTDPQQVWNPDDSSPSGLAYLDGHLWMAALRGERLWRVRVNGDRAVEPEGFFIGEYGRVRTVAVAPDGNLWVMTSNRDTRGTPRDGDDKILLVAP
ncbi:sorbosone dehydrogenase family protein [Nocardioides sp. cx-173]|uniref:PQQ-dependent sugar dehydrogenase n=1 Tax=Nocardioides sp. cx-173 TaxID=2898796 RepID=UPI001E323866|nr:PQQ-dependent sugar dehydrogenase [Nocardioides sp. cx-173]MCD4524427.1 PQQ-dependent sugar dehydrogenase [Nocardioides sp. cx-173]UGB43087.1 PQQ-dependent sugar dehydrogenase [Nocardioides sp. cx-173]